VKNQNNIKLQSSMNSNKTPFCFPKLDKEWIFKNYFVHFNLNRLTVRLVSKQT